MSPVKSAREALGMTQIQFAFELGESVYLVRKWETGDKAPGPEKREKLASLTGLPPEHFKGWVKDPDSPIRKRREALGISRNRLGKITGITVDQLYAYERGSHLPTGNNLRKLAAALGCSPEDIRPGYVEPVKRYTVQERNEIVVSLLNDIWAVINRNRTLVIATGIDREDLYQELAIGLIRAVDTYDPAKGKIRTHAGKTMKYALMEACRKWSNGGITNGPPGVNFTCSLDAALENVYQTAG